MNDQEYIKFRKTRDLGAIISDTIKFLGEEWKPFFGTIIKSAIIPIVVAVAAMIYYLMSSTTFFGSILDMGYLNDSSDVDFASLFVPFVIFMVAYLVAYALISVSGFAYIKSYIKNKGVVDFGEVDTVTKRKFGSYIGLLFLNGLIVGIGFLFCVLPAFYFGVVLSMSVCILVFDNMNVMDSISDSFNFVKGHWWETFGVLIVIQILVGMVGFVVDLPGSIYQGVSIGFGLDQDPTELINIFSDPIYLILVSFGIFVKFVLYMVTIVSTALIYFDIKEQKFPSTPDVIDEIGSHIG